MKIVLDTNVLISGLLNPQGSPAQILTLLLSNKIGLQCDNRIIAEYRKVMYRERFLFDHERIEALLEFIRTGCEYVTAEPTSAIFADDGDRPFFEVLGTGKADYLITGNIRHFPKNKTIITAKEFLERYRTSYDRGDV